MLTKPLLTSTEGSYSFEMAVGCWQMAENCSAPQVESGLAYSTRQLTLK
jgi:hypothetical protein